MQVEFTDNSREVKSELERKLEVALEAVGQQCEGHAKTYCPVDTGRLRNSITHTVDKQSAVIGTNVVYGKFVELGSSKGRAQPYLKPAIENHLNEYQAIIKQCLEN